MLSHLMGRTRMISSNMLKLNAGILGFNSAVVIDEPTKLTDTSSEVYKRMWKN